MTNLKRVAGEPPGPRRRRRGVLAAAGAAAVTLLVVLAVFLWPEGQRGAAGNSRGATDASGPGSPANNVSPGGAGRAANASASPSGSTAPLGASPKNSPTRRAAGSATTRPAGPVTVSVALVKTRLTYNGPCPPPSNKPILLTVDFTTSGPTTIEYYWKRDPAYDPAIYNLSMTVSKAGTTRATDGFYGGWSDTAGETISYWVQLVVTKPIAYTSQQLTWSTTCTTES